MKTWHPLSHRRARPSNFLFRKLNWAMEVYPVRGTFSILPSMPIPVSPVSPPFKLDGNEHLEWQMPHSFCFLLFFNNKKMSTFFGIIGQGYVWWSEAGWWRYWWEYGWVHYEAFAGVRACTSTPAPVAIDLSPRSLDGGRGLNFPKKI